MSRWDDFKEGFGKKAIAVSLAAGQFVLGGNFSNYAPKSSHKVGGNTEISQPVTPRTQPQNLENVRSQSPNVSSATPNHDKSQKSEESSVASNPNKATISTAPPKETISEVVPDRMDGWDKLGWAENIWQNKPQDKSHNDMQNTQNFWGGPQDALEAWADERKKKQEAESLNRATRRERQRLGKSKGRSQQDRAGSKLRRVKNTGQSKSRTGGSQEAHQASRRRKANGQSQNSNGRHTSPKREPNPEQSPIANALGKETQRNQFKSADTRGKSTAQAPLSNSAPKTTNNVATNDQARANAPTTKDTASRKTDVTRESPNNVVKAGEGQTADTKVLPRTSDGQQHSGSTNPKVVVPRSLDS